MNGIRFSVQVMKKLAMRAIRTSARPFLNHPFLVSGILLVILLYRSSPLLFLLLISASPVVVCTAVLLGTLLRFGHPPQIPEIDRDDSVSSLREIPMQNKTPAFQEEVVFAREYPIGRRKSVSARGDVYSVGKSKQVGLSIRSSREIVFEPQCVVEEAINECERGEVLGKTFENGGSPEGSVDGHMDHFEPSSMPWTRVDDGDEEEASDSGSESSLADIIPLLIECENSMNPAHSSNGSSINSDEEENKEDAGITWTEDDQKNVMDLGSSELERNRRVESLIIARRMGRTSMKTRNEKNLIDLDGFDLPFQVPTISTAFDGSIGIPGSAPSMLLPRRNPFDLPYDSSEEKPRRPFSVSQGTAYSSFIRQSSEVSESSSDVSESSAAQRRLPDSDMEHASLHVQHGSQSSEDAHPHLPMPEITLGNNLDADAWSLAASVANDVQEKHDSSSSSSSSDELGFNLMSETLEHISCSSSSLVPEEESLQHDEAMEDIDDNFDDSMEQALAASDSSDTMDFDASHCVEPVYDSSPRASKSHVPVSSDHFFAELDGKDVIQEIDSLLGENDTADEMNLCAIEEGNAAEEHSPSAQPDLVSLAATEEPETVNDHDSLLSDEAAKSVTESVNVPAFVEKKQTPDPYQSHYQEPRLQESSVISETPEGVNRINLQVVEPEPSEIIEQPCNENAGKSAIHVSLANTSVDIVQAAVEETIKQSNDEYGEKSVLVEKADAATDEFSDSHPISCAVEPEFCDNFEADLNNENDEIFGSIESGIIL